MKLSKATFLEPKAFSNRLKIIHLLAEGACPPADSAVTKARYAPEVCDGAGTALVEA